MVVLGCGGYGGLAGCRSGSVLSRGSGRHQGLQTLQLLAAEWFGAGEAPCWLLHTINQQAISTVGCAAAC